jgi:hypothetical protein
VHATKLFDPIEVRALQNKDVLSFSNISSSLLSSSKSWAGGKNTSVAKVIKIPGHLELFRSDMILVIQNNPFCVLVTF